MPWRESLAVDERMRFLVAYADEDDERSIAELCRQFGISRKTGYKWIDRYDEVGPDCLGTQPGERRPHPLRTPENVLREILRARKAHPFWGPRKLRCWLSDTRAEQSWPAASTIGTMLKREGLIRPRRRRPRSPPGAELHRGASSNDVWCADYKGHFVLGDKTRCHPLTISDEYSRYLIKCEALDNEKHQPAQEQFERAFREFGMPDSIRTDNGGPFSSLAVGGLSKLSIWWVRLGISPLRIDAGEPQQNGVHERMHKTLKAEATRPAARNLEEQQSVFDRFRAEFNDERPHESLGMKPPRKVYSTSRRAFPEQLKEPEYGSDFQVRHCSSNGVTMMAGLRIPLSTLFAGARIGFHRVDDELQNVFFGPVLLGKLISHEGKHRFVRS